MSKKLIDCWICGTPHEYCPTCGETHGWRYVADTREHYQIYLAKKNYEDEVYSKEEATEALAVYNIKAESDLSWMIPEVEKEIRNIIGDKPVKAKKSKLYKDE